MENSLAEIKANKKTARIAGLWYLLMPVFMVPAMMYVDTTFYVPGDTVSTINNILASEWICKFAFVSCLAGYICYLFLANALYKLFKPVDSNLARLMALFVGVGVAIGFLNRLNQLVPVLLLNSAVYQSTFDTSQLHALVMMFLDIHKHGEMIVGIFWGLWLFPLGRLIMKSNLIPKVFGVLMICSCFCWLIGVIAFFYFPGYMAVIEPPLLIVETAAEIPFIFWLLIKGVKNGKPDKVKPLEGSDK